MNLAVAVPLTDTRSSWPDEIDKVPARAGDDAAAEDEEEEAPAAGDGLVVAAEDEPSAPGDRKASGAVVPSGAEAEGADPFPP